MSSVVVEATAPDMVARFFEDLRLTLSEGQRPLVEKALGWWATYLGAFSEARREQLETDLTASAASDRQTVRRILQILAFLTDGVLSEEIVDPVRTTDEMATALQKAVATGQRQFSEPEAKHLRGIIGTLAARATELAHVRGSRDVIRGVLPMFDTLDATVELRSTRPPFALKPDGSATFDLVPLASLRLRLDSGDPSEVCFQTTEADLAALIERLQRLHGVLTNLRNDVRARATSNVSTV